MPEPELPNPKEKVRPTILIVDDEPGELATQLGDFTHPINMGVLTAADASEALKHLNDSKIDLILTDVVFRRSTHYDGLELAKFLEKATSDLPVVTYTNRSMLALEDIRGLALDHLNRSNMKYGSVFISYGGPDSQVASAINSYLKRNRIKTWFFPEDALPGQKLHRVMHDGVNSHDRVLLICSESSLTRAGVLNEIERVLEREAKEGGAEILIPISIDDFVFSRWKPALADVASQVRSRVISTFPNGDFNDPAFVTAASKLVMTLKK